MVGHWAKWARAGKRGGVVVAVVGDWGRELPALCPQVRTLAVATCPTTGALVLWLAAADALLLLAAKPPSHGSQTPGVMLPW
jgi:hypothetical protein